MARGEVRVGVDKRVHDERWTSSKQWVFLCKKEIDTALLASVRIRMKR